MNKPAVTILYVVTEDWYFWSHRLDLAQYAAKNGFNVMLATEAGEYSEKIRVCGIKLFQISVHRSIGNPLRELGTIFRLASLYRQTRPDLIHHIALKPIFAGSIAAWLAGVPKVMNSYTGLGHLFTADTVFSRLFLKVIVPFMSLILNGKRFHSIVQNRDDRDLLLSLKMIRKNNMTLIPGSGVDTSVFQASSEITSNYPIILFASRLLKDKGIIEFVEAARILKRESSDAKFVIVGKIDKANPTSIEEIQLQAWVNDGIVEWWGYREDMNEVFKQVHIVCLPSFYREGIPKVLLEAASCGRPIVTTDMPGCREVVQDGINGFLVPVKDPVSLANAIHRLLDSAELRKQMGAAGRKRVVENYGIDMVNSATVDLYNSFLSSK